MHVLMISDVYFPRVNGVSTSIATFRQSLTACDVHCSLIAPEYGNAHDRALRARVQPAARVDEIVRVPSWTVPLDPEDRLMRAAPLARALRRIDPRSVDLVHVQTPFRAHYAGVEFARRHGLPVIETYHTHFEEYFHHYLSWLPAAWLRGAARTLSRRQCNAVDVVIAPSPAMHEVLRRYGVERPIAVLPTGLDLPLFAAGDGLRFRRERGIAEHRPVLVVVSRVAHEKNIDFLVDVVDLVRRDLPDVLLMVAGEGPAETHLRELVARRGLVTNVMFVGYLDRQGPLQDCYRAGDLFVFASRSETQGLVLLEALALGVPVVALAELGTREIVLPQRGAVAAPADVGGFAAVTTDLLRDRLRRERMAGEGRAFAQGWATDAIARRLREIYATACRGAPDAADLVPT
jgi:glycosyltransferase involved in cell wall biosynthesis